MQIRQDPVTGLWAREDGAILLPPGTSKHSRFKKFRWTFGSVDKHGYRIVGYKGKKHKVHRLVCRTFNGLPPEGKAQVDHINRCRDDNRPCNLHWVDHAENMNNRKDIDKAFEKYGVRCCEARKAYNKAYMKVYATAKRAKMRAQGLTWRKSPNGKYGWYPFKRTANENKE